MGQSASCFRGSQGSCKPEAEHQVAVVQPELKQVVGVVPAVPAATSTAPDAQPSIKTKAPPDAATAEPIPADENPEAQDEANWGGVGTAEETFSPDGTLCEDGACCGSWNPTNRGCPMPPNEQIRKDTATALGLYGSAKCTELDVVLDALTRIFDAPYASIALYYNKCCWLANTSNFASGRMAWRVAACPWNCLVKQPQTIVCGELLEDARFRHQPWVKSGLRCYCSAPLLASNGHRMGTICFMDTVPRKVDAGMCRVLNNFGEIAMRVLERHLGLVQRLQAVQQSAPQQLSDLMDAASKGIPIQRVNSQGMAVQGPEAGHWADSTKAGHANGTGLTKRINSIGANLNRLPSSGLTHNNSSGFRRMDSSGGAGGLKHMNSSGKSDGLSPADLLLQTAFSRQLRHPEALQDACVLVVDTSKPGWPVIFADETWRLWAGFPRAEILGRNLCDLLHSSAPGVAPLNWDALQAQADALERFVLPGMLAVHPAHATSAFTTEQPAHCYIATAKAGAPNDAPNDGPQDLDMSAAKPTDTAADHSTAAGAASAPIVAASANSSKEFPLRAERSSASTTAIAQRAANTPSAEDVMQQVNEYEQARRAEIEMKRAAEAEAGGVQLGHEAIGTFMLSGRDHSTSHSHMMSATAAGSQQNSGIVCLNQASLGPASSNHPGGQATSANLATGAATGESRPFDLSFRPCALDVLDEDTLPLGMPSWVPLEVCEPMLKLYVVRLHERLSLPPPPQPLAPSLKLATRYSSTLAQLGSYLFPGLSIGQVLGRGGYGTAHLGRWHDVSVVVKVEDHELPDLTALRQAQLEISLGQMLRHPNLVRTLGHGAVELPPPPKPKIATATQTPVSTETRATTRAGTGQDAQADIGIVDSAAFDIFGGQISRWIGMSERPGDFMGDDKWLSHCDEAELFRRELFSRTTTFNVDLPDPSFMINASSIAHDAQVVVVPGAEGAENAGPTNLMGGGLSRPLINELRGGPSPFMDVIQEEGAVSGIMTHPSGNAVSASHSMAGKMANEVRDVMGSFTTSHQGKGASTSSQLVTTSVASLITASSSSVLAASSSTSEPGFQPDPAAAAPSFPAGTQPGAGSVTEAEVLHADQGITYMQPMLQPAVVVTQATTQQAAPPHTCTITSADSSCSVPSSVQPSSGSSQELPAPPTSAPAAPLLDAVPPMAVTHTPVCTSAPVEKTDTVDGSSNSCSALTSGHAAGLAVSSLSVELHAASVAASSPQATSAPTDCRKPDACDSSNAVVDSNSSAPMSFLHNSRFQKSGNVGAPASEEVAALLKSAEQHAERTHAKPMTFPLHLRTFAILEYCDGGTLQDAIDRGWIKRLHCSSSCPPDIPKLLQLAHNIAQGVACLHARGVVHADLSACNILLCKIRPKAKQGGPAKLLRSSTGPRQPEQEQEQEQQESNPAGSYPGLYRLPIRQYSLAPDRPRLATEMQFIAKVSDLGKACLLGPEGMIKAGSYATLTHCAPEVLRDRLLTPAADVYALGVLMWQMYTASRPYPSLSHAQIIAVVVHGTLGLEWTPPSQLGIRPYFKDAAEKLVALGQRCLSFEIYERPSINEVEEQLAGLLEEVAQWAEVATKEEEEELARTDPLEVQPEKLDLVAAGKQAALVGC